MRFGGQSIDFSCATREKKCQNMESHALPTGEQFLALDYVQTLFRE